MTPKTFALFLLTLLLAITICSCEGTSPENEETTEISSAIEDDSQIEQNREDDLDLQPAQSSEESSEPQLDDSRLPLEQASYWYSTDKAALDELPRQFVIDTEEAYFYAQVIRNYLYAGRNILEDFESPAEIEDVLLIALNRTTPIEWRWTQDNHPQGHVLDAVVDREEENGLCGLYYADDVQATIRKLFGDSADIPNESVKKFPYFAEETVYGCVDNYTGFLWEYPMLTAMQPTEDGMICEVIFVQVEDKDKPFLVRMSEEVTAENFASMAEILPRYRYTFTKEADGNLILTSLKTIHVDDSRLPLEKFSYWYSTDQAALGELPQQLVIDTQEAYFYAQVIRNYLCIGSNILEDFENVKEIKNTEHVIATALYHTTPMRWSGDRLHGHVLHAILDMPENDGLCGIYYADDVQATIRRMFGDDVNIPNKSITSHPYFEKENVYGRIGDYGGPWWGYPMLTAMQPTESGMICEVVLVMARDKDTPVHVQGFEEVTVENFAEATANLPRYRYTFTENVDGSLILTSLQTLQPETVEK